MNDQEPSILIPKIDVSETNVQESQVQNQDNQNMPITEQPTNKMKKINKPLLWISLFIGLFLLYNVVAGLLIYQSGMKLAESLKNLSAVAKTQDFTKIKSG